MLSTCNNLSENNSSSGGVVTKSKVEGNSEIHVNDLTNVDVLNSHGSIEGLERMVNFYDKVQNGVPSNLRIVHHTIEGDPIVTDVNYNGEVLEVKDDSTRDKFGSGAITINKCGNLIEEVNPINTTYIAVDCSDGLKGMQQILQITYNMKQQDLFEFELKYGINKENEINTLTNTLKKDSSKEGTQINRDFIITTEVKQEVYKRLVFANYLDKKDFTACGTGNTMNYFLKVHINGGVREFNWSACDQSIDGVKFTEIATYIIEQSEKKQEIQPQVIVQGYVLEKTDTELLIGEGLTMLDYEWMKDELQQKDFENYVFDFTFLEGVITKEFNPGEKILAIVEERIGDSKPGRAKVKEIKKLDLHYLNKE